MAIARTGTSKLVAASGTTISVARPTGAGVGDVLVLAIGTEDNSAIDPPPGQGWTELYDTQDGAANRRFAVYWRVDDGAAGPWTFSWDGSNVFRWYRCMSYSGCNAGDPISAFAAQINASSVNSIAPAVTPDVDNAMLVSFHNPDGATATWTPHSGMTAIDDTANACWAAQLQLSGGNGVSTGNKTGVFNAAAPNMGAQIALAPLAQATPVADYTKTTWADGVDATPTRLNNIESQVDSLSDRSRAMESDLGGYDLPSLSHGQGLLWTSAGWVAHTAAAAATLTGQNQEGSSNQWARADHDHAFPNFGTCHSADGANPSAQTFGANSLRYFAVVIPHRCTLTGIQYFVGGTSNGNVRAALYNAAGTRVADRTSNSAQPAANLLHQVAFDSTYVAAPGVYFIALIFSSATATALADIKVVPASAAAQGGFTTPSSITVPTVPAAGQTPCASTY